MNPTETLRALFDAALSAVDPSRALIPHLKRVEEMVHSDKAERLFVAGFGKGALPMALAAEAALGSRISSGIVIVPKGSDLSLIPGRMEVLKAGHPDPDAEGVAATQKVMHLSEAADAQSLLLLLVSGGGSALLTAPASGITLAEKLQTARLLMRAGADIRELNTVRKHLSLIKGGNLARIAHPARVVALVLSDVVGDPLEVIASGPAFSDPSTFEQARSVLLRRGIAALVPEAVRRRLESGAKGEIPETPKPGDPVFDRVETRVVARNRDALEGAARAALGMGLTVRVREEPVTGEAREAGAMLAEEALQVRRTLAPGEIICLLSGGETTVTVTGGGKGGRNQEVALAFALKVEGESGIALLCAGTDGIDGPTDAAGAIVDGFTSGRARRNGLEPEAFLADNNAYVLLEAADALLKTGPTGTNVMDLQAVLVTGATDQST